MSSLGSPAPYSEHLLAWYRSSRRDLPWRRSNHPYAIWISEVMLQQTQVATMLPYFERWMRELPTVESLAQADEAKVLSLWQGLGYYRRAKNLLSGAKLIVESGMPKDEQEWRRLPGIGRYTAGAIASIAQHVATPIVDGNVERVFARVKGRSSVGKELLDEAWLWAEEVLDPRAPGDWNQALMELGATVCKPTHPTCPNCPIKGWCYAYQTAKQSEFPAPAPRKTFLREYHTCWVIYSGQKFGVEPVPKGQWWEGMWQFPRLVHAKGDAPVVPIAELEDAWAESIDMISHSVTNHRINLNGLLIRAEKQASGLRWVSVEDLKDIALPAPQRRMLNKALKIL